MRKFVKWTLIVFGAFLLLGALAGPKKHWGPSSTCVTNETSLGWRSTCY